MNMTKSKNGDATDRTAFAGWNSEGFEIEEKPTKGEWVHVEGWRKGCVFEFQEYVDGFAVLRSPKKRKEYRTKNRLLRTRRNSNRTRQQ